MKLNPLLTTEENSQEQMTLLGFRFDDRPSVHAHIGFIREKFNSRAWMLRHLMGSGVPVNDVVQIYTSLIRPVIKYVNTVYHPMLNVVLAEELESMQRSAMRIIFGHWIPYCAALDSAGIHSLKERREDAFDKFARCQRIIQKMVSPPAVHPIRPPQDTISWRILRKYRKAV